MRGSPDIELPPLAERRHGEPHAGRKRAFLGGLVVISGGRFSFSCTIRNLSANGARLSFGAEEALPPDFVLINRRDGLGYLAHKVWARRGEAGVRLDRGFAMDAIPAELAYLNRFAASTH